MEVTVIGTGYVGTVTGACLAYLGHHVTCVDTDASKIARLQRGESPIYEPQLEQMLALGAARGGLDFSTELAGAVQRERCHLHRSRHSAATLREANLAYLEAAAKSIGAAMDGSKFRVVVNKSTVPVGSGNLVETLVREGSQRPAPRRPHPLRRGQQSGVSARRLGRRRFALPRPHRDRRRRRHPLRHARTLRAAGCSESSRRRPAFRARLP